MSKKRKTFSLSEENAEWLSAQDNASALVDRLITQYRNGGGDESVMLEYNLQELEADIEYHRSKLETFEDKKDYLEDKREKVMPEWQKTVNEAVEVIDGEISDVQAEHWADKAGIDVEEFKEAFNEAREEQ